MSLSSRNFINDVQKELYKFIRDYMESNVYVCFSHNEVKRVIEKDIEERPIIHISEIEAPVGSITSVSEDSKKGQKVYFEYNVYVVIDENYREKYPRYIVLNEVMSDLKYTFDNYKSNLNYFNSLKMEVSSGNLGRNPDNLYTKSSKLTFFIIKTLE